jgi:hypothetical protein
VRTGISYQTAQNRIIEQLPPEGEILFGPFRLGSDLAIKIRLPVLKPGYVGLFVIRAKGDTATQVTSGSS